MSLKQDTFDMFVISSVMALSSSYIIDIWPVLESLEPKFTSLQLPYLRSFIQGVGLTSGIVLSVSIIKSSCDHLYWLRFLLKIEFSLFSNTFRRIHGGCWERFFKNTNSALFQRLFWPYGIIGCRLVWERRWCSYRAILHLD